MAPFPEQVDVSTAPHWRMKQLVGLYCDKTNFTNNNDFGALLQYLYATLRNSKLYTQTINSQKCLASEKGLKNVKFETIQGAEPPRRGIALWGGLARNCTKERSALPGLVTPSFSKLHLYLHPKEKTFLHPPSITPARPPLRDNIIQKSRNQRLDDKNIEIMKEIPTRLLKKRKLQNYRHSTLEKQNSVQMEFPKGITFTYKERRKTFRTVDKAGIFWRKYRKDLGGERVQELEEEGLE
ncbi:Hypothetical predicted protein [Podarcis lilfordi]|uniref:Uncharacterized protein n=1 Tax=Podarcis lilfordi TaxID=74358 RepID=A0AA35KSS4_9SAUR|nr:Hypothetical predicted protein [Podarcis lilfordi]